MPGLLPPVQAGADGEHDPVLRRRLVGPGGTSRPDCADPVGLELLDDDAIEERAKDVAHVCVHTLPRRRHRELEVVAGEREMGAVQAEVRERAVGGTSSVTSAGAALMRARPIVVARRGS